MSDIEKLLLSEVPPEFLEYIWINESNKLRSATRLVGSSDFKDLPEWTYDGFFFDGEKDSKVTLHPRAEYKNPFHREPYKPRMFRKFIMCDTYNSNSEPSRTNNRFECSRLKLPSYYRFSSRFFFQQDYFLLDPSRDRPIDFLGKGDLHERYLSASSGPKLFGHDVAEAHFKACHVAGIEIPAMQAEGSLGRGMFQIKTSMVRGADMVWMARYFLQRIAEMKGLEVRYGERDNSANDINLSTWVEHKADKHGNSFGSATEKGVVKELLLIRTRDDREDSLDSESDKAVEDCILHQGRLRVGNLDPYVLMRKLLERVDRLPKDWFDEEDIDDDL